jgi:hypothetical protein
VRRQAAECTNAERIVLGLEAELNEVEMDMQIELTDPCSPHDVLRQFSRVGREAWLVHVVPRILAEF